MKPLWFAKEVEDLKAMRHFRKPLACPYCGSTWLLEHGLTSFRCRKCLAVFRK